MLRARISVAARVATIRLSASMPVGLPAAAVSVLPQRRHNSDGPNVGPGRAFIEGFMSSLRRQVEENKQLKDNVKLLASEAEKISESDSMKRAKEIMEKANKEGKGATSQALKKTGEVARKVGETVKDTVNTVAETPIGRATTETIKTASDAVGKAAEAAVRPITESETYQQVTRDLAQAIQDSSSRYGGITSKRYRELLKQKRLLDHARRANITENAEATGMVLHSNSPWTSTWERFVDTNPMVQNLVTARRKIAESDNLAVSWARYVADSIQDKFGGMFEETETARALTRLKELDPEFSLESFLKEAREFILPEILEAWLAGDKETLTQWCSEASVKVLTAGHDELVKQNLVSDSRLLELKGVELSQAKLLEGNFPVVCLTFHTQETILFRDRVTREVRLGKEDVIMRCAYVGVFTIEEGNQNPITRGWRLVEQSKHAGTASF